MTATIHNILRSLNFKNIKVNLLAGLTVSLALIPEAVAFALIAGVDPIVGLSAAFIVGLVTGLIGGKPGMISGATGALAVVMVSLVQNHGVEYLFATVVLMGIIQVMAGVFHLGKFIRMVPFPVMLGFVNGLAIVIMLSQFQHFKVIGSSNDIQWMTSNNLFTMITLVGITMLIIKVLPKFTKAIPSALVAILVVIGIVYAFNINTNTVSDLASISGSLPPFNLPNIPFNMESLKIIFPYAFILSLIGLIESLLTLKLLADMTNKPGCYKKECIAQGLANLITGFFGGMGGCAMIGQSMINVNSGANSRLSAIFAALALLFFVLIGSSLIAIIPIAALVGVMFIVVLNTFEWDSFKLLFKMPKGDAFVMLAVTIITVIFDLAIAVTIGVIISSLIFAWKYSFQLSVTSGAECNKRKLYNIKGPIFFSSVSQFIASFDIENDPPHIELDLSNAKIFDCSALDAIKKIKEDYKNLNKKLHLINVSPSCRKIINKSGRVFI